MDIKTLQGALLLSWSEETAAGEWQKACPSLNQCAVTALIVQDYLGGDLLRCKMTNGDTHYWNRLFDSTEIDLTIDQFLCIPAQPIKIDFIVRNREYVLSFPNTVIRYELLKTRVQNVLKNT
jgi:hypothetical protein